MKKFNRDTVLGELRTRKYVRKIIKEKAKENKLTEQKVREKIQNKLNEAKASKIPYGNTGINILEDVLKQIVPVLREDYKDLTSHKLQRKSFRNHVIDAVKKSLLPIQNYHKAVSDYKDKARERVNELEDDEDTLSEQEPEEEIDSVDVDPKMDRELGDKIKTDPPDDDEEGNEKFIDVPDGEEREDAEENEEEFAIGGEDVTGRNLALRSFNKVEKNIKEGFELLSNEEDRELFYDYLITNLKLYFERWESEVSDRVNQDDDIPDEALNEASCRHQNNPRNVTRPDPYDTSHDERKGWRVHKESTTRSLKEGGYEKYSKKSLSKLKKDINKLREMYAEAKKQENDKLIKKIDGYIGNLIAAYHQKKNNA